MNDFIDDDFKLLLGAHGLNSFESLSSLALEPVDDANTGRGGYSEVCRLSLKDAAGCEQHFFIKRQRNHLIRSLLCPWGEPTFAREFKNILLYKSYNIAALDAVYFGRRKTERGQEAILITRALTEYRPWSDYVESWSGLAEEQRTKMLEIAANLIGRLHAKRIVHRCCYPKHIFINLEIEPSARFIDLENARYSWAPMRDSVLDLEAFIRRCDNLTKAEIDCFLSAYLAANKVGLTKKGLTRRIMSRTHKKAKNKMAVAQ